MKSLMKNLKGEQDLRGKRFSYDELACVTNSFNDKEKLGQGGFGGGLYRIFKGLKTPLLLLKRYQKNLDKE